MRILMVSDHGDPLAPPGGEEVGGQNVYVHRLSCGIAAKGHRVDVVTRWSDPDSPRVQRASGGYTVYRVPVGPVAFMPKEEFACLLPLFTAEVLSRARAGAYDILHSHYWISGAAALEVMERLRLPLVHMYHSLGMMKNHELRGIDAAHMEQRERAERAIAARADRIIAESPGERRMLLRSYGAEAGRVVVIPAGVDTRLFRPGKKDVARRRLGITRRCVILYVGRFVAQKGIPTLLHAYAVMRNTLSDRERRETVLLLVGGDPSQGTAKERQQFSRIRTIVETLKLHRAVRFVGNVANADLPRYYHAADICVVPSRYEPFGIVPLEAMACGVPVVASFTGGMKTTVLNLRTGLHARPNDVMDFAHKMRLLLRNTRMRAEFGAEGRRHVVASYDWEGVTNRVLACYSSLIPAA